LIDYHEKENENYLKFLKEFQKTGNIEYPTKSRFSKLDDPIVETTSNIWSIIPFYGSSLVHVYPSSRERTIEACGWGTDRDINNLIQLAKDTGRVQFILDSSPLEYEHHDYLEPILSELHPPVNELIPHFLFDNKEFKKAEAEFTTLSGHKFIPFLREVFDHYRSIDAIPSSFDNLYSKHVMNYVTLRLSGYDDIADNILNSLIDNPTLAWHYSHFYGVLVADNKQSTFKLTYNPILSIGIEPLRFITDEISKMSNQTISTDLNNVTITDVGQSLFNKLALGSEGYLGCLSLIDKYEQQDTQRLLIAIQNGLKSKRIDAVQSNASELSEVLDNLWNDSKISKLSNGIGFGIPISLGTIGPLTAEITSGIAGVLAGIGFRVLDKKLTPVVTKSLSKGLAKIFRNDHLLAIYDFKKKYKLCE